MREADTEAILVAVTPRETYPKRAIVDPGWEVHSSEDSECPGHSGIVIIRCMEATRGLKEGARTTSWAVPIYEGSELGWEMGPGRVRPDPKC